MGEEKSAFVHSAGNQIPVLKKRLLKEQRNLPRLVMPLQFISLESTILGELTECHTTWQRQMSCG